MLIPGAVLQVTPTRRGDPPFLVKVKLVSGRTVYTDKGVFDAKQLDKPGTIPNTAALQTRHSRFQTGATSQIRRPGRRKS